MSLLDESSPIQGQLVYTPKDPQSTRIAKFQRHIASTYDSAEVAKDYHWFWKWSVDHPDLFWKEVWEEVGIIASQKYNQVVESPIKLYPPPKWFLGARLNIAENLLCHSIPSPNNDLIHKTAVIQATEPSLENPNDYHLQTLTNSQLRSQVTYLSSILRKVGIKSGDRIASYASNCTANLVAFLATASIGAIWISAAADFAPDGVLERLTTVRPKVLFAVDAVRYNGKVHDHIAKVEEVVKGLRKTEEQEGGKEKLEKVILIPYISSEDGNDRVGEAVKRNSWEHWEALLHEGKELGSELVFEQLDFNHPLWILFSSGTTGKPKAITHRAGGMLLQLAKEHLLHGGMTPEDVFFQYTTPGWMMWNFVITGLISGAPIVLFDGSPLKPPSILWRLADQLGITIFGTSAAYLAALEKSGFEPRKELASLKVKQVLSTGSPLRADLYPFLMRAVGPETLIGSITGGTDICSLFAGHNVMLPVRAGEIQARNLGMNVDVFDNVGHSILSPNQPGDLVCKTPFPAQPLGFWSQPESKHYETYYSQFENVWYHGDFVQLSEQGGMVMLGRSDGILNPGGIRFGSSEIYETLEACKMYGDMKHIQQSLVCSLKTIKGDDEVVVLFLVLAEEFEVERWRELENLIKKVIREKRSARHVPKFIRPVKGVPLTMNGKLAEVPAKKLINGAPLSSINRATLQNPGVLNEFATMGEMLRSELSKPSTAM